MMLALSDSGPKPNSGTVEQKKALTGALVADAKCKGPESLTKLCCAPAMSAADCKSVN
jgi:hypothetical protein